MKPHIRIEVPDVAGKPAVVMNDRIVAVGEDGTEVDVSSLCAEWNVKNRAGSVRKVELVFYGLYVKQDGVGRLEKETS